MKTFDHFPQDHAVCPICGTRKDKACFLIPIDDTDKDHICEAQPAHVDCITSRLEDLRLKREPRIIYFWQK